MNTTIITIEAIKEEYANASGAWTGCDWTTSHGKTGLDLDGVTAEQAREKLEALEAEVEDWKSAIEWLEQVESDAASAQSQADLAMLPSYPGNNWNPWHAIGFAEKAASIEREYGDAPTWGGLEKLIEAYIKQCRSQ